jgi:hypothetical protein
MTMDKATLLTGDYYVLDVTDPADAPVCICVAAIMDYWLYNRNRKKEQETVLEVTFPQNC